MGALWEKLRPLYRYVSKLQVGLYASQASFYLVLSFFPGLVLLLGLLRYTGLDINSFLAFVEGILPQAFMPAAKKLIMSTYLGSTGTLLSLSALTALWSASRGVLGLMTGLCSIYKTPFRGGYFRRRLVSAGYTLVFLGVLLLTLGLSVLAMDGTALPGFLANAVNFRFLLLLLLQLGLFSGLYLAALGGKTPLGQVLPGACLSCVGWLVFSQVYSFYVTYFTRYLSIYGSVYAVALSLLWLYCCISIVFYGAALNRLLWNQ